MTSRSAANSGRRSPIWLAEIAFRLGGSLGVYLLSQLCVIVTYWAVFQLGRATVGERHAALAVLLMVGITTLSVPTPDFGPAILSMPLWALALLHFWRAIGDGQRGYWYALALDIGLLLLTTYLGLLLGSLLLVFTFAHRTRHGAVRTIDPWIAGCRGRDRALSASGLDRSAWRPSLSRNPDSIDDNLLVWAAAARDPDRQPCRPR